MFQEIENEQSTASVVGTDVDKVGGWIVEHHQATRTWDIRMKISEVDAQISQAQSDVEKSQQKIADLTALKNATK